LTHDGFESQFQANYLDHFYLFQLLLELILKSAPRKVISISSSSSEKGTCDLITQNETVARVTAAAYDAMKSYRESKLARVLFTVEAARRCATEGVWSYAVNPGVVNTDLFYRNNSDFYKRIMQPLARLGYRTGRIKTPAQGADTAIYLATTDVPENGAYWADKQLRPMNPIAQNAAFWDWSTGLTPVQR
jgi:NAD(P)-dependent dehydrogenase (short-subunit alcohol dehydrogenase family)